MPMYDYKSGDIIRAAQDYRVVETLGAGGMGGVYLAEHRELYRNFAVKVLHANLWHRADLIEMFGYEARTVARLGQPEPHPGIIEVVDLGRTKDRGQMPYMVMPYLVGETLHDALVRKGTLPILEAVGIVTRLLQALDHAHRRGVVHRDVKPQNIFVPQVAEGIAIRVLDWGISKLLAQADDPRVFLGTPAWASKEQMLGQGIGPLSDVYSSAAVLFRCLTGTMPFGRYGTDFKDLLAAVHVPAPRLREFGDFPRELDELVASGLSKDPAARPRDALAFAEELQKIGLAIRNDRNPHTHATERVDHGPRALQLMRPDPITEAHIAARTVEDPKIQQWIEAQRRRWNTEEARGAAPTRTLEANAPDPARAVLGLAKTEPHRARRQLTEPMPRHFGRDDRAAPVRAGDGDGPPSYRRAMRELPTRRSGPPSIVAGLEGSVRYVTSEQGLLQGPLAHVRSTVPIAPQRMTVPMAQTESQTPMPLVVPVPPARSLASWARTKYRWFFGSSSWTQLGRPLLVSAVGAMLVVFAVLRFGGASAFSSTPRLVDPSQGAAETDAPSSARTASENIGALPVHDVTPPAPSSTLTIPARATEISLPEPPGPPRETPSANEGTAKAAANERPANVSPNERTAKAAADERAAKATESARTHRSSEAVRAGAVVVAPAARSNVAGSSPSIGSARAANSAQHAAPPAPKASSSTFNDYIREM